MHSSRKCSTPIPIHWEVMEFIEDKVGAKYRTCIEIGKRRAKSIGNGQKTAQRLINGGEKQI